ncbi:ABC-2 transporter permease [Clostridium sp. MSJ-11]|uniref:ABC-2 transporter permease n=1 Tax=Clostridium mobile TaxID=2841512 RepID=A0ABS6ELH1_9CLOT|nr:ABC-2 transporter permease [Clostridium mobile]MBU5485647.1 ABC-2 transporter permease [Clostridium mobile]
MFNLIVKDILVQKRSLIAILIYLLICTYSFKSMPSGTVLGLVTVTMVFFFITGCYAYDERNKSHIVLNSLPITRRELIISKYISVIIYNIIALSIMTLFMFAAKFLNLPLTIHFFTLKDIVNVFITSLLLASFMFPVYSKFGFTKSRVITFITYFTFFTIANILSNISDKETINIFSSLLQTLSNNTYILLIIALLIYFLSMYFCIKIYVNKELD